MRKKVFVIVFIWLWIYHSWSSSFIIQNGGVILNLVFVFSTLSYSTLPELIFPSKSCVQKKEILKKMRNNLSILYVSKILQGFFFKLFVSQSMSIVQSDLSMHQNKYITKYTKYLWIKGVNLIDFFPYFLLFVNLFLKSLSFISVCINLVPTNITPQKFTFWLL